MKLLNLNIGIKLDNSEKVIELLKKVNADMVTLQEVCRPLDVNTKPMFRSQEYIDNSLKDTYPYNFFGPLWTANAIRKNGVITRDFGGFIEQGNEILSKFPIKEATNKHYYNTYSLALDWSEWEKHDHARSLQTTILDTVNIV